jgi:hypothetical protein
LRRELFGFQFLSRRGVVAPVVIAGYERIVRAAELENWIRESGKSGGWQGWAESSNGDFLGGIAGNNKAADGDILADVDVEAGRNV